MDYSHFVQWVFYGLLSFGAFSIIRILGELKDGVQLLNEKVAVVIEKTAWHEKRLEEHHERIREIETKK